MAGQISRRRLLQGAVGVVTVAALPDVRVSVGSKRTRAAAASQVEFPQPRVRRSRGGHLAVRLISRPATVEMGAPVRARTWA